MGGEGLFFFIPFYPQDSGCKVWVRLKETKPVDNWVIHQADSIHSSLEESKGRKSNSCLLGQSAQWIPLGKGIQGQRPREMSGKERLFNYSIN